VTGCCCGTAAALVEPAAIAASGRRTLVLVGEYDTIAPARELSAAFERAPQVELHVIPHADHFVGEGLAEIARLASAWLEPE
jgi:pimeloyl-ACP methyl ester carboxylesterase